jgi:hypothetical protein
MFSKQGFIDICLVILIALLIAGCFAPTTPTQVAITGVTLDRATMILIVRGVTGTLVATVVPATATNQSVTWSSSAPEVATVVDGVVTPLKKGKTTITVTTVDGSFAATCTVTVMAITSVVVVPPAITTTSTIINGAVAPTVIVTGTNFKSDITTADLTVGIGTTGLTLGTVSFVSATEITVAFTGTAAGGNVIIQANTSAFDPTSVLASNTLTVTVPLVIGNSYGGGKVAYLLVESDPGYDVNIQHGLIAATDDQSTGILWYNGANVTTGAIAIVLGTGFANTNTIITVQGAPTPTIIDYAANVARAYNGGGYNDWYLPSKDELNFLYINRVAIGGFAGSGYVYWSSSEADVSHAWVHGFGNGDIISQSGSKDGSDFEYSARVRAVRAF